MEHADSGHNYNAIMVFETDFQKSIVDVIKKQHYQGRDVLLIDARHFKMTIGNDTYSVNLNGFRNATKSTKHLMRLPHLHTDELLCTAFTGINSRIFPALIEYRKLILIDDGSGTPAILKSSKYPWTRKLRIRFIYANIVMLIMKGRFLGGTRTLLRKASGYYGIYDFVDKDFSDFTKNLHIVHVDYFSRYKFDRILMGVVGYVSNGTTNKEHLLCDVYKRTGVKPVYYPHPHEDVASIDVEHVLKISKPDCILEEYFMRQGIPQMLFGDSSTVFINLRMAGYPADRITIYYDKTIMHDAYYEIFSGLGVHMITR